MPVASGLALAIRLRFHNHAPEQLAIGLAFHQQATDEVGGDQLGRAGKKLWGRDERTWVMGGMVAMGVAWVGWMEAIGRRWVMRYWHKALIPRDRKVTREIS